MLLCPVRNCHLPLQLDGRRRVCAAGHSFDIARSGYTNLLQPQERRSQRPGDTPQAVAARRRLHDRGVTRPLLNGISRLLRLTPADCILDAGCGDGFYLGNLASESGCQAHGIDISIPAVDAAARRFPAVVWIVSNADRFIPYSDGAFSVVLSVTARMNPAEFHRLLQPAGRLLIALPAPDDLVELRSAGRDRVPRTVSDFDPHFRLLHQERVTTTATLPPDAIHDLRLTIYRPRTMPVDIVQAASQSVDQNVTFSLDLLLLEVLPKPPAVLLNQTA